jgi:hypothetical protein
MKIARKMMELDRLVFFEYGARNGLGRERRERQRYSDGSYAPLVSFDDKLYHNYLNFFSNKSYRVIEKIREEALDEQIKLDKDWVAFQTAYEKSKKLYESLVAKIAELQKTVETKKLLIRQSNGKN